MSRKKIFEVKENESLSDCLERINKEGYKPIRRMEKPIFKEIIKDGEVEFEPVGSHIQFEAKPLDK